MGPQVLTLLTFGLKDFLLHHRARNLGLHWTTSRHFCILGTTAITSLLTIRALERTVPSVLRNRVTEVVESPYEARVEKVNCLQLVPAGLAILLPHTVTIVHEAQFGTP